MSNKKVQLREALNKYRQARNEIFPKIENIINDLDNTDGVELSTEVSRLFRVSIDYVRSVEEITGLSIMDQPRRSVTTLAEAVDNVRKTCEQYRLAVDKALIMTECSNESIRRILNEITEHEQMVIRLCEK